MSIWEILGIAETSDKVAIKKAFAAKVKEIHPAEHPEEYMQLQEAYQWALKYADRIKSRAALQATAQVTPQTTSPQVMSPAKPIDSATEEKSGSPEFDYSELNEKKIELEEVRLDQRIDWFLEEAEAIFLHPNLRNDCNCWEYYLNRPDNVELLKHDETRQRLVVLICSKERVWWYIHTIRLIDGILKKYHLEPGKEYETETQGWQKLLNRKKDKKIWHVLEPDEFYEKLDRRMSLSSKYLCGDHNIERYLNQYFVIALSSKRQLTAQRNFTENKRRLVLVGITIATGYLAAMILTLIFS